MDWISKDETAYYCVRFFDYIGPTRRLRSICNRFFDYIGTDGLIVTTPLHLSLIVRYERNVLPYRVNEMGSVLLFCYSPSPSWPL